MKHALLAIFLCASAVFAQTPAQAPAAADPEQTELNRALSEVGSSAIDIIHVLEQHLAKYPNSARRDTIEQTLYKSAVELNDSDRIIRYGEKILANPTRDLQMMDRVTFELTKKGDAESGKEALAYVKRYENGIASFRQQDPPPQHFTPGQWGDQMDRVEARALALESRAKFDLGDLAGALESGRDSWKLFPNADAARSLAEIYSKMDRPAEAMDALADAFTLEDPGTNEADRAADRAKLGALHTKVNGSGKGLGDLILRAYDRTSAAKKDHTKALAAKDPNAVADDIFGFTLPGVGSTAPLALSSLKGKVLVLDFWATWCVPCRAQHPIFENVMKRFGGNKDVVFLPLDSDDDLKLAAPFLKEQQWDQKAWFEGGLERKLMVGSIPTVVIVDPSGKVSSRMIGLIPERFEQMLTERIDDALAVSSLSTASRP